MERTVADIASDLLRLGKVNEARRIVDKEIARIDEGSSSSELWRLRLIRAQLFEVQGRIAEALQYLESLGPPDSLDRASTAALKQRQGACTGYLGRYEASHRLFEEADAIARDAGHLDLLGDIHLSQAFIYFRQKDYISSTAIFRSVLDLSGNVGGWYLRGHGLWGIGKNQMIQGRYQQALPWLEESLGIFERAEAPLLVAMVWGELGVCYLGLGDDLKAMDLLRKAELVNYECRSVHNYQVVLADIGNVYLHRGDHFMAISYYQRAVAIARDIKDPVSTKKWTRNINLAYARIRLAVDQQNPRIA